MTTAAFATKAHGRVSAYNLYCLAPTGNSLKAGFVNLYTRSSLDLRYKSIIRYSIELCQQDGHVSFVKAQFYRYNLTFPMISRILKISSTKDWRNNYEWFKQILLYFVGYCKYYPRDILTIKSAY